MSYKKDIYLLLFKNQILRLGSWAKCFCKRNRGGRKSLSFNPRGTKRNTRSLEEISEIAHNLFGKTPLTVKFLSQSKFGLNSYEVSYKKQGLGLLKCRETFSTDYTERLDKIIKVLIANNIKIPSVLAKYENLIFSPWVKGKNIRLNDFIFNDLLLEKLAQYQASIHSCSLPRDIENKVNKKSQYLDFLARRFIFFGSQYTNPGELVEIANLLRKNTPSLQLSITHPDFNENNIILEKGEPILIDNETLNVDLGYEYDILNTVESFFSRSTPLQEYYFALYKKYHSLGTLETNLGFWRLVYLMRAAGSNFQQGNYPKGIRLKEVIKHNLYEQ